MGNNDQQAFGASSVDRRSWPRTPVVQVIQLQHPAGPQLGELHDLSCGGLGVTVEDSPPIGSQVNVVLELSSHHRLDAMSVVVRVGPVVGLRFVDLRPHEVVALQAFLVHRNPRIS